MHFSEIFLQNLLQANDLNGYRTLRNIIINANENYYNLHNNIVTDDIYDKLFDKLIMLEKQNPSWVDARSPSQTVGSKIRDRYVKMVKHNAPMLSLEKTTTHNGITKFIEGIQKELVEDKLQFSCEPKMDGSAISLIYQEGILTHAITRGDGEFGDDVTDNVLTISSIPKILPQPINMEVRGEIFIKTADFAKLQILLQKEDAPKNPRNFASGSLQQKDKEITRKRPLSFYAYAAFIKDKDIPNAKYNLNSYSGIISFLEHLQIPTNSKLKVCTNANECIDYCEYIHQKRDVLGYGIDGIVIKLDNIDLQQKLGSRARSPKWAIAFKLPPLEKHTQLLDVSIQVGRTGVITPVAHLSPICIDGVTVSRATLHNFDEIKRLDLCINDTVIVSRAGDVIPKISERLLNFRSTDAKPISIPENCPSCKHQLVYDSNLNNGILRCPNRYKCNAQIEKRIIYFASRDGMDIEGLSDKAITFLYRYTELVKDEADLYTLTVENMLASLESIANEAINDIDYSKYSLQGKSVRIINLNINHEYFKMIIENFNGLNITKPTHHSDIIIYNKNSDSKFLKARNAKFIDIREFINKYSLNSQFEQLKQFKANKNTAAYKTQDELFQTILEQIYSININADDFVNQIWLYDDNSPPKQYMHALLESIGITIWDKNKKNTHEQITHVLAYKHTDVIQSQTAEFIEYNDFINSAKCVQQANILEQLPNWIENKKEDKLTLVQKIINNIQKSRNKQLHKFIYALGILGIGEASAKTLASFGNIHRVMQAKKELLACLPDIGTKSADNIYNFFHDEYNKNIVLRLLQYLQLTPTMQPLSDATIPSKAFALALDINEKTAEQLLEIYGSYRKIIVSFEDNILNLDCVSYDTTKAKISQYLANHSNRQYLLELEEQIAELIHPFNDTKQHENNKLLLGQTWVITGQLSKPRQFFVEQLELLGAKVTSKVTRKTSCLLAGIEAGNKLDDAKKFAIKIIDEPEYNLIVKNS